MKIPKHCIDAYFKKELHKPSHQDEILDTEKKLPGYRAVQYSSESSGLSKYANNHSCSQLHDYLRSVLSLTNEDYPHKLVP